MEEHGHMKRKEGIRAKTILGIQINGQSVYEQNTHNNNNNNNNKSEQSKRFKDTKETKWQGKLMTVRWEDEKLDGECFSWMTMAGGTDAHDSWDNGAIRAATFNQAV